MSDDSSSPHLRPEDSSPVNSKQTAQPAHPLGHQPPMRDGQIQPTTDPHNRSSVSSITQSKIAVLGILFLVTGALGLPLLWVNRRFSNAERWLWTIAIVTYTVMLIGVTFAILSWTYRRLFP